MSALVIEKFHKHQALVHKTPSRFKVVVAGRRWGKTSFSRVELILEALKGADKLVWYIAPTYAMAHDIMWGPLCASIPRSYLTKKPNDTKMTITLKNGSMIQCKGSDKPDRLRGRGVDYAVLDEYEDFKANTWEEVVFPTLTDRRGAALIIGTPKSFNQLHKLYLKGQSIDPNDSDWSSWQFPTASSPFIPKSELIAAQRNMDERTFNQEFLASFETMTGRVYYPFDRHAHVGDFPFDPANYIIVGQDFNVDPMCSVILQIKPNGDLWAVDEIVLSQSNTQETVQEIERRYFRLFPNRVLIFPDPAGGNRSSARGESDVQIFREKGITRIHYHKKHPFVADRVNAVNARLRSADGTIRLRIDKRCRNLVASLEQTIYKPNSREVDKSLGTEHIADALGYPIEFLFPMKHRLALMGVSR